MLVNLLHPSFEPIVDCDVVSTDGYSVTNLVSSSLRERNQGFLAAHFIRPPVLVLFQLPFPVSVESLVLKPKVGSQISTGIEIFVARSKWKPQENHALSGKDVSRPFRGPKAKRQKLTTGTQRVQDDTCVCDASSEAKKPALHEYLEAITVATFKAEHMQLFTQVGRFFGQDGRTICVVDPRFHEGRDNVPVESQLEKFRQLHLLRCITHLALRITRVNGSGAAAIGKIELWGKPAPSCGQEILEYARQIQMRMCAESKNKLPPGSCDGGRVSLKQGGNKTSVVSSHDLAKTDNTHQSSPETQETACRIPEEFTDAITCNIMTIPMLLPSGHNVDSTTLDKHFTAEQMWGRTPSDPFTGIPFSDKHKAVPNSALKVRIDKFLLSSGLNVRGYARTVGRAHKVPTACSDHRAVHVFPNNRLYSHSDKTQPGSSVQRTHQCESSTALIQKAGDLSESKDKPVNEAQERSWSEADQKVVGDLHHEDIVSQSLDMALHKTLQGLSTFTRKQPSQSPQALVYVSTLLGGPRDSLVAPVSVQAPPSTVQPVDRFVDKANINPGVCICCQRSFADSTPFQLPCRHLMCRECVTAKSSLPDDRTCDRCGERFSRTAVVRVHHV